MHINFTALIALAASVAAKAALAYLAIHGAKAAQAAKAHLEARTAQIKNPVERAAAEVAVKVAESAAPAVESAATAELQKVASNPQSALDFAKAIEKLAGRTQSPSLVVDGLFSRVEIPQESPFVSHTIKTTTTTVPASNDAPAPQSTGGAK